MHKRIAMIISLITAMLFLAFPTYASSTQDNHMRIEVSLTNSNQDTTEIFDIFILALDPGAPHSPNAKDGLYILEIPEGTSMDLPALKFTEIGVFTYRIWIGNQPNDAIQYDPSVYDLVVYVTREVGAVDFDIQYNLYKHDDPTKQDFISFVNHFEGMVDDVVIPPRDSGPKLPLTGSVDLYYILGLMSLSVGLVLFFSRTKKEH